MTDVFISYARENRPKVQVIAEALTDLGLRVWWDPHIKTGAGFREEIQASLSEAAAVIVIWSQYSVGSRFVCDEADEGAARGILFPALIDLVDIPLGFRQIQTADLTKWRGNKNDKAFKEFISVVAAFMRASSPAPAKKIEPAPVVEEEPAEEPKKEPTKKKQEKKVRPKPVKAPRSEKPAKSPTHFVTGARLRWALLWRAVALTILVAGAFGALAYNSDFIYAAYRPFIVGALAILVFVSRFALFESDRSGGVASLRLLSRSYVGLLLFSLISIAPLMMQGRLYTEALQAVQIKGIEGADINGVDFDRTGALMATASDDGTARVWATASGVQKQRFKGHENWVWSARFSPDSKSVVTGSLDLTARVWDIGSGNVRFVLTGHTANVLDAIYNLDGGIIATASADRTIKIWNAGTGELERTLRGHVSRINALATSPDGHFLASADGSGMVRVWNWSGDALAVLQAPGGNLQDVAIDRAGTRVATASDDGRAFVWNISSRQRIASVNHGAKLFAVEFVGNDELVTGGIDASARVWEISSGELVRELKGHLDAVRDLAVSPDEQWIATASRDNTARIWNAATGEEAQIVGHIEPALQIPFSLDIPPALYSSRAPTSANLISRPDLVARLLGQGVLVALAILFLGQLIKGIAMLVKARALSQWASVSLLSLGGLYTLAMTLTDLPIEASYLWLIAGFIPAALFATLLWLVRGVMFGHGGRAIARA